MNSMTAYAYKEFSNQDYTVIIELRGVNSRYCDMIFNIPSHFGQFEALLKKILLDRIARGKVEVFIRVKELQKKAHICVNANLAKEYYDAIKNVAINLGIDEHTIPLTHILAQEGVLISEAIHDDFALWDLINPMLLEVLDDFCAERRREGGKLKHDIILQISRIEKAVQIFVEYSSDMEQIFKQNIQNRLNEFLGNTIDEQRLLSEVGIMLVKYTINEEIVRLQAHLEALKNEIEVNISPGKKIDFFCQEINREINTIGSKNQIIEISLAVVDAKDALENIREQSRNVE